jgi:hypothetical protein
MKTAVETVFVGKNRLYNRRFLQMCSHYLVEPVRVDPNGWEVVTNPPVYFRRSLGMQSLPIPERGGSIADLQRFVNVKSRDFCLVVAWLLAALRPRGPYPVLILAGETGSAKSTLAKILRRFTDPDSAPLRSPPRSLDDLQVEARYSWLPTYDNFSRITQAFSDAFCRLATGGGSVQRQYYTKTGQVRFNATRPVILNGIPDLLSQPDLQNRSIVLILPRLVSKKTEAQLFAELEVCSGRIFGALLDLIVTGLRNLSDTVLADSGLRMAEFATWSMAAGLGDEFVNRYSGNLMDSTISLLEGHRLATAIETMILEKREWEGSISELAVTLRGYGYDVTQTPEKLCHEVRKLAPAMRLGLGIDIERLDRREFVRPFKISLIGPASQRPQL